MRFPQNFTVEFDLIILFDEYNDGEVALSYYETLPDEQMDGLVPGKGGMQLGLTGDVIKAFNWFDASYSDIDINLEKDYLRQKKEQKVRVSIAIQNQRTRLYLDGEKFLDIPRIIPKGLTMDRLRFFKYGAGSENFQFFISNFRIAETTPDTRNKLITEGRWVTRGIYFDPGSDKIKPELYGTLKEISSVLKENPDVKFKIIGHTHSDGTDESNLDLSKKRSFSVKDALSSEFGIDAGQMETDGKGESEPVSDNTTTEGKADNRRVEFVKI